MPQQAAWFGLQLPGRLPAPTRDFAHGGTVQIGTATFAVRHAPGHSPGSVCLIGHGVALTGDVLFAGSIGRTDLPGGNAETLLKSIRNVLFRFPDDTVVWSGHGEETTIGRERKTNPYLT